MQNLITPLPPLHISWPKSQASLMEADVPVSILASLSSILYVISCPIVLPLFWLSSLCKAKGKNLIVTACDLIPANFPASPRIPGLFHTSHTGFQVHSQLGKCNLFQECSSLTYSHSSLPDFTLVSFQTSSIREAFSNYSI